MIKINDVEWLYQTYRTALHNDQIKKKGFLEKRVKRMLKQLDCRIFRGEKVSGKEYHEQL